MACNRLGLPTTRQKVIDATGRLSRQSLQHILQVTVRVEQRWKIETYHKILKCGCRAGQSKLRTAERIVNLLAMFSYSVGVSPG